jgi:hypothetical protein
LRSVFAIDTFDNKKHLFKLRLRQQPGKSLETTSTKSNFNDKSENNALGELSAVLFEF